MTVGEIIAAVKAEGGLDATDAQAGAWVADRYQRLVAGSQWYKQMLDIGPTVAGEAQYVLPDTVIDVRWVAVGTPRWSLVSQDDLQDLKSGVRTLGGRGGVFASAFQAAAEAIELWPVPTTDGLAVTAFCALAPAPQNLTDTPAIPLDFHHALVAGGIAEGLKRLDEQFEEAGAWEQEFQDAIEMLRRRRNSRVGSGPAQIQLRA